MDSDLNTNSQSPSGRKPQSGLAPEPGGKPRAASQRVRRPLEWICGCIRNTVYLLLLALLFPWLLIRCWRGGRDRRGWRQKFFGLSPSDVTWTTAGNLTTVWFHGVSVGEILLLQTLVKQLRERLPDVRICISTTTPTGMQLARQCMPKDCMLFYFPLDFSWAIKRCLGALQPNLIVLGELELWPNLLSICKTQQIPVMVANGRLSENSFRGYQRVLPIVRPMFSSLRYVGAQTQEYAERFSKCGTPSSHVQVTGSIKFDNVAFDRHSEPVQRLRSLCGLGSDGAERVLVAGSTQEEEETIALEAYQQLKPKWASLKLILVPRHPLRSDGIAQFAARHHRNGEPLVVLRRSQLESPVAPDAWDVLLVDCVGELVYWWALAEVALVGGTFGARGGQNMIEPAAYGCNTVFGPRTSNFRDAVGLLLAADAATQLSGEEDFASWLDKQLADPTQGQKRGQNAIQLIRQQQGALGKTLDVIVAILGEKAESLQS